MVLAGLRTAKAGEQIATLLARDPASHASLDDAMKTEWLLNALRSVGATEQVAALLARDPASHVRLDNPTGTNLLLDALRRAGAHEQAEILVGRTRRLGVLHAREEHSVQLDEFRFGRQGDGNPAKPWDWDSLD
jgi:hypothetical protein